jgi:transcriptional regulator with XRE-family HTH domain
MEDLRIGAWIRAERRRLGLRQSDLAIRARVSEQTVGRIERGQLARVTVAKVRSVAAAAQIQLPFAPRSWRGAAADRQLDWRHAALVEVVVATLKADGWEVMPEWSFNHFGDRGSVDVLAWHSGLRALLIVEVKSDIRNVQESLRALDVKCRVVPRLMRAGNGWAAAAVGVVLVVADVRAERNRIDRHRATFASVLPARTVEVKRWLRQPVGPLRGIWFLQIPRPVALVHGSSARERQPAPRRVVSSHSSGSIHPGASVRREKHEHAAEEVQSRSRLDSELATPFAESAETGPRQR